MELVAPEGIDRSFVPRRAPVPSAEVDGEVVVVGPGDVFYRLDPLASLIWSCLDGSGTAEEIAADLAAELGGPPSAVCDDVVAVTRILGHLGLLEGVQHEEVEPRWTGVPAPTTALPNRGRWVVEPPSG